MRKHGSYGGDIVNGELGVTCATQDLPDGSEEMVFKRCMGAERVADTGKDEPPLYVVVRISE